MSIIKMMMFYFGMFLLIAGAMIFGKAQTELVFNFADIVFRYYFLKTLAGLAFGAIGFTIMEQAC